MPSEFDSNLAFALGNGAAALVAAGATAYMATAHCLTSPVAEWRIAGSPLVSMMSADRRSGAAVAIIRPSEVDLRSASFRRFKLMRERLAMEDLYCNPGPMQFASLLAARAPAGRLSADDAGRAADLEEVEAICREVAAACWPGCHADVLRSTLAGLRAVHTTLGLLRDRAVEGNSVAFAHVNMSQLSSEQIAQRDN